MVHGSGLSNLIERGEFLAAKLAAFRNKEGVQFPELGLRAKQLEDAISARAAILRTPMPRVAFVAHKGVGKSTLINALANLWIEEPSTDWAAKQLVAHAMLPLGNGGTTPCEIEIQPGPWQIRLEPADGKETEQTIRDFAEWAWDKARSGPEVTSATVEDENLEEPPRNGTPPRLQPDIERVVRGMTELHEHHITTAATSGGRPVRTRKDDAVELASIHSDKESFVAAVLSRARLESRRRVQWLPEGDPQRWIKKTLLDLIEGKLAEQPFPARMIVHAPSTGVQWRGRDVGLVDTLGLPAVASKQRERGSKSRPLAERRDLRELLKSAWTLVVVGAQFNEPPAPSTELLQQMVEESLFFGETLADRTIVAIVDAGMAGVGMTRDPETDRANKEDRCAENVARLGCPLDDGTTDTWSVSHARERVLCVNVLDGGTDALRAFLATSLDRMEHAHRERMVREVSAAEDFLRGLDDAKRRALRTAVIDAYKNYLDAAAHDLIGKINAFRSNLLRPFAAECREIHHSTLRSMVIHRGDGTRNAWALLESATVRELGRLVGALQTNIEHTARALRSDARYRNDATALSVIEEERDRRKRLFDEFRNRPTRRADGRAPVAVARVSISCHDTPSASFEGLKQARPIRSRRRA